MREEGFISEEIAVLREAEVGFQNLPKASGEVVRKSNALLTEERELFGQAMVFQLAAVRWVTRGEPISDDGLRAAISLACYVFDMLLCGWNSLTRGFYAVALHSVRDIDQAVITEVAVMLNQNAARKFWEGELEDVEARKVLQKALELEDQAFAERWASDRKDLRNLLHKLVHPGRTAITPSIVIAPDGQSAIPIVGGEFIEERSRGIARLYTSLAFDAAVQASQAFKPVLPPDGKLKQKFDELVGWGKPLIDSWGKEMGFS
jgi:hypothetical protein